MTNTRDKLNETKYFLNEMNRVCLNPDHFRYTLTAFLSASRSITQIMQAEFSNEVDFPEWYKQKQEELQKDSALKYLHAQRRLSYHARPILQYPIGITEQITEGKRVNAFLTGTGGTLVHSTFLDHPRLLPSTDVKYFFDDIPEKDVIIICQDAVNTLGKIVEECEIKFRDGNTSNFKFV